MALRLVASSALLLAAAGAQNLPASLMRTLAPPSQEAGYSDFGAPSATPIDSRGAPPLPGNSAQPGGVLRTDCQDTRRSGGVQFCEPFVDYSVQSFLRADAVDQQVRSDYEEWRRNTLPGLRSAHYSCEHLYRKVQCAVKFNKCLRGDPEPLSPCKDMRERYLSACGIKDDVEIPVEVFAEPPACFSTLDDKDWQIMAQQLGGDQKEVADPLLPNDVQPKKVEAPKAVDQNTPAEEDSSKYQLFTKPPKMVMPPSSAPVRAGPRQRTYGYEQPPLPEQIPFSDFEGASTAKSHD